MGFHNLNSLRHFDAAARHLNLRLAAEELSVTQGAISQQIKLLEQTFQVKLFLRHPRGLSLTEAGARLHQPVREALALVSSAIAKLQSYSDRVLLSLPPSFAAKWLVPRLARFAEIHPNVDLQIITSGQDPEHLGDTLDLALWQGTAPADGKHRVEQLAPLRMVAVSGPSLIARAPVLPRASFFAQYPLIEDAQRPWRAWFAAEAPDLDFQQISVSQTALAIDAAEAGQGIALVPDLLVRDALDRGRLVKLREEPADSTQGLYLLHPAHSPDSHAKQVVIDWIRSLV